MAKLTTKQLATLRIQYCAGILSLTTLSKVHHITIKRIKKIAAEKEWVRLEPKNGKKSKASPSLKIEGVECQYIGPLTEEERLIVAQVTNHIVDDVLVHHRRVSFKALFAAEMMLDRLIVDKGMLEMVKTNTDGSTLKMTVPATDKLKDIATVLAKTIPLERRAVGLDIQPGTGGVKDAEMREREAREREQAIGIEVIERFERRYKLLGTNPEPVVINGHDKTPPRLGKPAA